MHSILVVEDEAVIAADIEGTLVGLGYRVTGTCASAAEAIASVEREKPSLALMDVNIKGSSDGIEAARVLRARFGVPVVFLTSYSDDATLSRAQETLPYGYLIKPFSDRELRTTIEIALHKHGSDQRTEQTQRELEQRLLASDRLATVGTMAASILHEVNNPLSYVAANTTFALRALESQRVRLSAVEGLNPELLRRLLREGAEAIEALKETLEGAGRLRKMVEDMRGLARADDQRKVLVDLPNVLDAATKMTAHLLPRNTRLFKKYSITPFVEASEGQLIQVFVNLIANAAQAVDPKTNELQTVSVETRTDERGRAVVEVKDSGPGIGQEQLAKIFQPFFTTKPAGVGTGLGLSIAQGMVQKLSGEIAVESRLGDGACFRVVLPGARQSQVTRRDP